MDKYAVIKIGSSQYKVHEGDTLFVNKQNGDISADVLLFSDGRETVIGDPLVKGVSVKLKITGEKRGRKVVVSRFKSKSRYRKTRGYRDEISEVLVEKIEISSGKEQKPVVKAESAPVTEKKEKQPVKKVAADKKPVTKKPAIKAKKPVKKEAK